MAQPSAAVSKNPKAAKALPTVARASPGSSRLARVVGSAAAGLCLLDRGSIPDPALEALLDGLLGVGAG